MPRLEMELSNPFFASSALGFSGSDSKAVGSLVPTALRSFPYAPHTLGVGPTVNAGFPPTHGPT
jgi:hypothetical protein